MDLKALWQEDDAVSPVIGVILMVAITVILAAVIASFVLGLGQQAGNNAPQASFGWEYDNANDVVTVTHESGDAIDAGNLVFRGDIGSGAAGASPDIDSPDTTWATGAGMADGSEVNAGMQVTVGTTGDDYEISLVYQNPNKDSSTTLASDSGPDA